MGLQLHFQSYTPTAPPSVVYDPIKYRVLIGCHISFTILLLLLQFHRNSFVKTAFILKVKVAELCPTLCDPMDYSPWNSPGQNTGVGSPSLLQGIFPNQG